MNTAARYAPGVVRPRPEGTTESAHAKIARWNSRRMGGQ